MSTYKHLADLLKLCSVLPALAIMPAMADTAQYTNPADVINWSNNEYKATDSKRTGGVLKVAGGDKIDEINAGEVKGNSITMTKTDGYNSEVFGQGSVLYNNGTIGKITGTFENNSITNMSATASKATANGGAFALYAGTNIDSIQAGFTGNSVTAQYSGDGTTSYADGNQISAGGGAMHIQGAFGDGDVTIGTIAGDFTNNSANGDGYANGGAIYIKGGANDRDIPDEYAVHIGKIEGDFTGNKATATTGTTKNKKNSTGGAISVKIDSEKGENGDVVIDEIVGDFANNSVQTNTTDALGGAIYNEGTVKVTGDFSENTATATSTEGKGYGGAIYNVGTMSVGGTFTGNKATKQGGAVWNSGTLNIADGSVFSENSNANGSAIYNDYKAGKLTIGDNVKFSGNLTGAAVYGGGEIKIGDGAEFTGNAGGIALSAFNNGSLEIGDNAVFTKNNSKKGGAAININVGADKFVMGNNAKFSENTSTQVGGALYIANNDATLGTGYTFENNTGAQGGALAYNGKNADAVLSLDNFTFDTNHAIGSTNKTAGGGALFISNGVTGTVDIKNSTFEKNDSTVAGGAILQENGSTATMTIDGSTFAQNQTDAEGGAVVSDATLVVKNSTFTGNKTTGTKVVETGKPVLDANGGGGAIFLYDESNTTISGSTFTGNESGTYGGAISTRMGADSEVSSLTLSDSEFKTNIAKANGGAIFNTVKTTIGDGMLFEDNNANNGGAIWNERGATLSFANTKLVEFKHNVAGNAGGAIYNAGVIDKISHVSFQKNEGKFGGAINNSNLIGKNQGGYIGEISNSSFIDNNAGTNQGGAIRNQGRIDKIADVLFSGNRSGNGGALNNGTWGSVVGSITDVEFSGNIAEGGEGQGGAIVNAGNIALIDDSEFNSNRADVKGGAIANVAPQDTDGTAIATITLKNTDFTGNKAGEQGGAIYNDERGNIVLGGENLFSGNTAAGVANDIHNEGSLVISGGVTKLGGGITGTGNLTIKDGATLSIGTTSIQQSEIALNGTLAAQIVNEKSFAKIQTENIVVGENGVLDLMLGSVGTYNIGVTVPEAKIAYNDSVYNVKFNEDNNMVVSLKSVAEIAENNGVSSNAATVLTGLMSSQDDTLNIAALNVQEALARGDTEYVETGTAKLLPQDKPVAQSVATSVQNQVLSVATNRMSGAMVAGRNGGDFANAEYGVWAQGLYNHSKYADEFTGDTMGIAVGADALIADKYTIGIGYAYNESDVEAKNDVDITSNSLFVYGQYKPNQWYVNGTLNYTMSNYTNKVAAFGIVHDEEYDVDSFGGQLMGGYDMAFGLTPEAGVRYLHIAQDGYNSVLGAVSDASYDYLTGVIGAKYAFTIESGSDWLFRPELRAAATYDFMSDESIATVDIPGIGSYVMPGERLSRFGGEFGIGLAALYNGWEISVNYDLDLHQDYTSHTGMLKFRYDF